MFIILMVMMVDLTAFSLLFPVFPLVQEIYKIPVNHLGYVIQVFAISMMIGSITFGYLSDKFGRKYILSIPLLFASISYLMTANSTTFEGFLICRALSGFCSGSFAVAFATTTDISTPENRLKNMSTIGAAFGLSFMVGPILGGIITSFSSDHLVQLHLPFYFSSIASLFAFSITILFFKETLRKKTQYTNVAVQKSNVIIDIFKVLSNKKIMFFTLMNIVFVSILAGLQVYLGLYLYSKLGLSPTQVGFFWSITALTLTITQIIIRKFFSHSNPSVLMIFGFLGLSFGFILLAILESYLPFVILSALIIYVSVACLQSSLSTNISLAGHQDQQGLIFGINQSIGGVGRAIGPVFIGVLIAIISYNFTWSVLGLICLLLSIFNLWILKRKKIVI